MKDRFHEGQYIVGKVSRPTAREMIPPIFDYIEYEFNKQSVWELFLLSISYEYMPLFWHAAYAHVTRIFEMSDLEMLVSGRRIMHYDSSRNERIDITDKVAAYVGDESLLPAITMLSEREALIHITYWGSWRGLVRCVIRVAKENNTTTIDCISTKTLVEYDCGIIF